MQYQEKEYLLNRISSKYQICRIGNSKYRLYSPTSENLYLAAELHKEVMSDAYYKGAISQEDALDLLMKNGLWTVEMASELETMTKNLDVLKLELFNSAFKSNAVMKLRKAIKFTYEQIDKLEEKKSVFDYLTAEGIAVFAKTSFLISSNIRSLDNSDVRTDARFLEHAISYCNNKSIKEAQFRELARSEPWSSTFSAGKTGWDIFGAHASELTIEQKILMFWSRIYRNIHESPDCPHKSIIDDDWMLDGWFIKQAKEREANQKKKSAEDSSNISAKIGNAQEIFLPADTQEDAQKLTDALNTAEARSIKRQRDKFIQEKGEVNEANLPDVRMDLQMKYNQMFSNQIKGV